MFCVLLQNGFVFKTKEEATYTNSWCNDRNGYLYNIQGQPVEVIAFGFKSSEAIAYWIE